MKLPQKQNKNKMTSNYNNGQASNEKYISKIYITGVLQIEVVVSGALEVFSCCPYGWPIGNEFWNEKIKKR